MSAARKWLTWLGVGAGVLVVTSVVYVAVRDAGTITVRYAESQQPYHQQLRGSLQQWGGIEAAAAELDTILLLPQSLDIWFADCGQSNAVYVPESREVILCYELVSDLVRAYSPRAATESALATAVWQTTFFVFDELCAGATPVCRRRRDGPEQFECRSGRGVWDVQGAPNR